MRIHIRTDASNEIGSGHVMRCLTLADELKSQANVAFICKETKGNLIAYIHSRGYPVHVVPCQDDSWEEDARHTIAYLHRWQKKATWLIVDHYGLDARYEAVVHPCARKIMVIDDLANRPHRCDLLLDQNLYDHPEERYSKLVMPDTKLRLGPRYALLKPDFAAAKTFVNRSDEVVSLLVSFGGADPTGETIKTLQAVKQLEERHPGKLSAKVLTGKINAQAERIRALCGELDNVQCVDHAENMAELMSEADLAIGSGGTTTWERCCLGLPAIVIMTAENQVELSECASKNNLIALLGRAEDVRAEHIRDKVLEFIRNVELRTTMSSRGKELVDGLGAGRMMKELMKC
ncbi:UDP-2,4-diacetamido-2,4,6-trideoxy-beta-L-altropyranose hydrolase [Cohnella herbarum]|uniref:UDP-2,4-diacetamido-2,4, 6-trideoxy-beta-L-altropyranose hydrolase n=1 Tax=Cohnella herbarum TaxID=2728023 RepID=A0A7Z2VQR2_9BACL|nr:UDP-2,4-diacetamido-2,4,6-trideoxy-beta-L-altropyranose hydrolase [Cohnella herbarum]QJD87195.1 UDP-2,4-diacetamido-2,4,6-trideoxy-beta-L-altropyranose hydrolase [Cohnella herbarum]